MRMRRLLWIAAVALVALVPAVHAQKEKEKKVRHDSRVITAEEIAEKTTPQNALEIVRSMRPAWLTGRGPTTIMMQETGVSVYVDGTRRGSMDELRLINRDQIEELRYFTATDAQSRFGMDNVGGAIEVKTRKS